MTEPRPEAIQAIVSAVVDMTPESIARLANLTHITPEERERADQLILAQMEAEMPHRERVSAAWNALMDGRTFEQPPAGWAEFFDGMSAASIERLGGDLYTAMPDGARAEYDARFGPPDLS
jgi:hypothetical protein